MRSRDRRLAVTRPDDDETVGSLQLRLHYVHGDDIGYGRVGAALAAALRRRGIVVHDEASPEHTGSPATPPVVTWISSPFHALGCWTRQRPTVVTMWETDLLPGSFRRSLARFETVLVPSDENLELFRTHHPDVRRVSFGVDAARWNLTPRRPHDHDFEFFVAGTGSRKGVDLAHTAFQRAFPSRSSGPGPRPHLVIKGPRNEIYASDRVTVIRGPLSAAEERARYDRAHCYLQPSRGEGFGLQPLQAIAMGIPTILTDAHGHRAYAHLGIPIPAHKVPADIFVFGTAGSWWEADLDHLVAAMRWVYDHYDTALADATASAAVAARTMSWDVGAAELVAALGGSAALATPLRAAGPWRSFDEPHHPVVTRRDFAIDSAGVRHAFVRDVEQPAPAHVKRLLFEAGLLDDRCLDLPLAALSPVEIQRLDPTRRDEYLAWVVEAKRRPPAGSRHAAT